MADDGSLIDGGKVTPSAGGARSRYAVSWRQWSEIASDAPPKPVGARRLGRASACPNWICWRGRSTTKKRELIEAHLTVFADLAVTRWLERRTN
jgi:hypothetical protein